MRRLSAPSKPKAKRPGRLRLWLRRSRRHARVAAIGAAALVVIGGGVFAWRAAEPGRAIAGWQENLLDLSAAWGLSVEDITVEGRRHAAGPALLDATGLSRGAPILGVDLAEVRTRLEAMPWIARATVQRRLPHHIHVVVIEREPFALWQRQGRFALIDRSGRVIVENDVAPFAGLPLVVGTGAAPVAASLLDELARFPEVKHRVTAAVRVAERRWNLRLASGADVMLPEGAETAAIERLAALHRDAGLLDRGLVAIDMRLPDRLVLRPVAAPEPPPTPGNRTATRRPT
jgi:cell division protein FtsQ